MQYTENTYEYRKTSMYPLNLYDMYLLTVKDEAASTCCVDPSFVSAVFPLLMLGCLCFKWEFKFDVFPPAFFNIFEQILHLDVFCDTFVKYLQTKLFGGAILQ